MDVVPTILLVEDAEHDVILLKTRFARSRLMNPLRVVPDGSAAIRYLSGEGDYRDRSLYPLPGIVVLDLALPKLDGFEVLRWIRSKPEFASMPVIIFTGYAEDPLVARAKQLGADGYLMKGADVDGLIHLLQNAYLGWALVPRPRQDRAAAP